MYLSSRVQSDCSDHLSEQLEPMIINGFVVGDFGEKMKEDTEDSAQLNIHKLKIS